MFSFVWKAGDWYCSKDCKSKSSSKSSPSPEHDHINEFTKNVMWQGLMHQVRLDAERENDGKLLNTLWKTDVPFFWAENHNKYMIQGHRLTAGEHA